VSDQPQETAMITFAAHPALVPELLALSITSEDDLNHVINEAILLYVAINDLPIGVALDIHHNGTLWRRIMVMPQASLLTNLWRLLRRKAPR